MGKGKIISGGTSGLYQVELIRDVARLEHQRLAFERMITAFTTEILLTLEPAASLAETEKDTALATLNSTISDYQNGLATKEQVNEALKNYTDKVTVYQMASKILDLKRTEKAGLQKRIDALKLPAENPVVSAWCADLTTDLSEIVGTIEIPGERGLVNIKPGYDGAVYSASADGILQPAMAGTPANVANNLAMLPGWQKFRPTYRTGRITSFSGEMTKCSVNLDQAKSSAQGLSVNQSSKLSSVSFDYMGPAGSTAFDVNDQTIIKFQNQNWNNPVIIGFKNNPKPGRICIRLNVDIPSYTGEVTPVHGAEIYVIDYFEWDHIPPIVPIPIDVDYIYDSTYRYWKIEILKEGFTTGWVFYRCRLWAPLPTLPQFWLGGCIQYPNRQIITPGDPNSDFQVGDRIGYGYYIDTFEEYS